jgi:hypothetical protein
LFKPAKRAIHGSPVLVARITSEFHIAAAIDHAA